MSKSLSRRLLSRAAQPSKWKTASQCVRLFSHSARKQDDEISNLLAEASNTEPKTSSPTDPKPDRFSYGKSTPSVSLNPQAKPGAMSSLAGMIDRNNQDRNAARRNLLLNPFGSNLFEKQDTRPPHQLHVYAHRHNCHITLWGPPNSVRINKKKDKGSFKGGAILSISAGQIGFRHSGRKHYDSAFQLASYAFARMAEAGVSQDIQRLELYLRGFGAGREAVTKALLGTEGKLLRNKIIKVADTTRLKIGGTRSPKPRRLG